MSNPKDQIGKTKPPLALLPSGGVVHTALAMGNGARKYGPFNWRDAPVEVLEYLNAAHRHLLAFMDGEDVAADSGVHHLGHACAGLMILLDAIECGTAIDNRPAPGKAAELIEQYTARIPKRRRSR